MDIVICTNEEVLEHKQNDFLCYWDMARVPRKTCLHERVYFAVKGIIKGSFEIVTLSSDEGEIEFRSESWRDIKKQIKCKHFRGFRYRWWD